VGNPIQGCSFTGRLEASADASPADRITFLDRQMIADMEQQVLASADFKPEPLPPEYFQSA